MSNEQHYDSYDEFYCRDLIPLSDKLTELATDGNRYHYMLATRLLGAQNARWLIKPETGFISPEHEAFFRTSFTLNVNRGLFLAGTGSSGFINGAVWGQLDDDPELEVIPDAAQPIWGFAQGAMDESRKAFEAWHLSGKGIRAAWRIAQIPAKVAAGDRMKAAGVSDGVIQAKYKGWLPDNGSLPTLNVGSLV